MAVGNEAMLRELGVGNSLESIPMTSVYVVEEGELLGRIAFADSVKPGVKEALKKLKGFLKTYLFSGDKKNWSKPWEVNWASTKASAAFSPEKR